MRVEDVVVLGLAVPEERRDGRRTVCLAGYSSSLGGLVRIYPVRADANLHRWDIIAADIERNPQDSRHESWKLAGSQAGWNDLNQSIDKRGQVRPVDRRDLLDMLEDPCVGVVNRARRSLGVIRVARIDNAYFGPNEQHGRARQPMLGALADQPWVHIKQDYPIEPRLAFHCPECPNGHDQKVLEWGAYEWMRKCELSGAAPGQYWENLRLYDDAYDHMLIVGNQQNQRTSFLVISVIPIKTVARVRFGARYARQISLAFEADAQRTEDGLAAGDLAHMPYADYVLTGHWQSVRAETLRNADGHCQVCGSRQRLEVHHNTYARRGSERPADVIALCSDCHQRHHRNGRDRMEKQGCGHG
jgi:hypothetical protein